MKGIRQCGYIYLGNRCSMSIKNIECPYRYIDVDEARKECKYLIVMRERNEFRV